MPTRDEKSRQEYRKQKEKKAREGSPDVDVRHNVDVRHKNAYTPE